MKLSVPYQDVVFNSEVIADIMYIQGKIVLHLVDRATHFQAGGSTSKTRFAGGSIVSAA